MEENRLIEIKPSELIEFMIKQSPNESLEVIKSGCVSEMRKQEDAFNNNKKTLLEEMTMYWVMEIILAFIIGYVYGNNLNNLFKGNINKYYYLSQFVLILVIIFQYSVYKMRMFKQMVYTDCEKSFEVLNSLLKNNTDIEYIKSYVDFDKAWTYVYENGIMVPISDMLFEIWFRFHWVKWILIKMKKFFLKKI